MKLWQVSDIGVWSNKATFEDFYDFVNSVAFSLDKTMIVSGSADETIHIWQVNEKGEWNHKIVLHEKGDTEEYGSNVTSIVLSSDKKMIVAGFSNGSIKIWQTHNENWIETTILGHSSDVISLALSSDKKMIVSSAGNDNIIKIWLADDQNNWSNQQRPAVVLLGSHNDLVTALAVSQDKTMIATGSIRGIIRIWKANDKSWINVQKPTEVFIGHQCEVTSIALSSDNSILITGFRDGTFKIWQVGSQDN